MHNKENLSITSRYFILYIPSEEMHIFTIFFYHFYKYIYIYVYHYPK